MVIRIATGMGSAIGMGRKAGCGFATRDLPLVDAPDLRTTMSDELKSDTMATLTLNSCAIFGENGGRECLKSRNLQKAVIAT